MAQDAMTARGAPASTRKVFVDAREHGVQSRHVVGHLGEVLAELSEGVFRTAILVATTLHKM